MNWNPARFQFVLWLLLQPGGRRRDNEEANDEEEG